MIRNKQILVAVLNWGLGHATRSIPIIHGLINDQNIITLASDGAALSLLQSEFPKLSFLELPGYDVTYPTRNMTWNIVTQLPKIRRAIRTENQVVDEWISKNEIDIIISDNRYGCYNSATENVFISHQLNLQVPFSNVVNRLHARMIDRYNQVWIVDDENQSLSGDLSDPKWLGDAIELKYLGSQSRLEKVTAKERYDVAAVLSGPEPQRTLLEQELIDQLSQLDLKSILVQGSKNVPSVESRNNLTIIPFANPDLLSNLIIGSDLIICRSGYSTIMDLDKLGGKALFIPTPGQTEQIYLAERFQYKRMAQCQHQGMLDIEKAWKEKEQVTGF